MKIIINNRAFDYDLGCRLLKLKYKEPFEGLEDIWEDIVPLSFKEILKIPNVEDRRAAIDCLGLERLHQQVNSVLVDTKTINKTTTWVLENGEVKTFSYEDTYSLYKIPKGYFSNQNDAWNTLEEYYVVFKDTSTDRQYLLWVNIFSVNRVNRPKEFLSEKADALEAIAWTIMTDVPEGEISEIIRQGDCILIKPKGKYTKLSSPRHLTKKEYVELLTCES